MSRLRDQAAREEEALENIINYYSYVLNGVNNYIHNNNSS